MHTTPRQNRIVSTRMVRSRSSRIHPAVSFVMAWRTVVPPRRIFSDYSPTRRRSTTLLPRQWLQVREPRVFHVSVQAYRRSTISLGCSLIHRSGGTQDAADLDRFIKVFQACAAESLQPKA